MSQLDSITSQIVARIEALRKDFERSKSLHSPFTVLNEGTPAQLTGSVNDYDIGNYDVLRMSSSAAWNVSGFAGGKQGRLLRVINVGAQNIVLLHNSGLSAAINQIISASAANITLQTTDSAHLYYDGVTLKWRIIVPNA